MRIFFAEIQPMDPKKILQKEPNSNSISKMSHGTFCKSLSFASPPCIPEIIILLKNLLFLASALHAEDYFRSQKQHFAKL